VVNAYVPWWRDDEYYDESWHGTQELDGGGALMNQSIHGVDAVQWLASSAMGTAVGDNPVEEVFAYTDRRAHDDSVIEVEDTAVAVVRYRDGTLGQILGTTSMYPGSLKRIQVAGRGGTAEIMEDELVTWSFRSEQLGDDEIRATFGEETRTAAALPIPCPSITATIGATSRRSSTLLEPVNRTPCLPKRPELRLRLSNRSTSRPRPAGRSASAKTSEWVSA